MLNFDEGRYLRIQEGAVSQAEPLHQILRERLSAGAKRLIFAGAGGAGILMQPAVDLLQRTSRFPVYGVLPAELVVTGSAQLDADTVVVIPSLSGTTKESISALQFARDAEAFVITLTGHADSPLAVNADATFTNFAEDDTSCESFYLQSLIIALSLRDLAGESPAGERERIVAELRKLPAALLEAKRAFEGRAADVARTIAASGYHIITGAGASWPEAYYYGMCILEEMQWIRTRPVHASDFFHGSLELVEEGVSVLVLAGEGPTRALTERVQAFVPQVGGVVTVLDTADADLPGISASTRELIGPAIHSALLERTSAHLEVLRDHPLTTRRYYRRIDY